MTVLRSRKVKSGVESLSKSNSSNSTNTKQPRVSSIEPITPAVTRETHSIDASSQMTDTSRSGSVRRSRRLASKNSDGLKICDDDVKESEVVSSVSSRKRKSVLGVSKGIGVDLSEEGLELEGAVVEDLIGSDSSRKRKSVSSGIEKEIKVGGGESEDGVELEDVVVEDSIGSDSGDEEGSGKGLEKGEGKGKVGSEGGVELEDVVVEDSMGSGMDVGSGKGSEEVLKKGRGKRTVGFGLGLGIENGGEGESGGGLRLRSGKKVAGRGGVRGIFDNVDVLMGDDRGGDDGEKGGGEENGGQGGLKLSYDEMEVGKGEVLPEVDEGTKDKAVSNKKVKGKVVDMGVQSEANKVEVTNGEDEAVKKDGSFDWKSYLKGNNPTADRYRAIMARINKGAKRDGVDVWEELISKCVEGVKAKLANAGTGSSSNKGKGSVRDELGGPSDVGRRRLSTSRQEKGKGKLADDFVESEPPKVEISDSGNITMQDGVPQAPRAERSNSDNVPMQDGAHGQENVGDNATRTRERFRAQARKSASRFAFFSSAEGEQSHVVDEAEADMAPKEADSEMEDWPGPFSTAMKIIKERGNLQQKDSSSGKETPQVTWVPKQEKNHKRSNLSVPLLQDLCMIALTKNADAITSLDYVPDVLRHKLTHMLCDMRKMNCHFLELLVRGSPTEIRIRDCSWLSEEDFTKNFEGADISNLAVLQLDQCGRCMPDYILYSTLGRSPNCLPALTTLSLKGACRLSDNGLNSLLSSAPALRSLNLSQCSLLTSGGINSLADSLGSVLRELYLDDCESIDPILILPALSKLEYLEVLSLAGLYTVCDDFICQLIALRGHKLKELVLADCVCTGICALDLTNLCKLTDSALGYLANGCRSIRSLKLRRNNFSDEAVAAYLETSGGSLEELSLNNVSKVAYNTAISLSKCSMNLQSLDLSFCRKLPNEAVGLIADGCLSLKTLKLFGCTQITNVFLDGHSNKQVQVIGLQLTPILGHIKVPELIGPLRYSAVSSL
ncbi:uncharacterized protein LOC141704678 isoform X2 [Apium graveolens]|uniref:uncharacterized protein LOC141704678 isoform X2 n=1 Tax=Apium graveolens TaxID=4045 RepID=UPI003D7AFA78